MSTLPAAAVRSLSSTFDGSRRDSEMRVAPRRVEHVPPADCPPDQGIASYFIWLRRHTGLSIHQTAAMLHTESEVISALEAGAICELPPWPETSRVVAAYCALARVEPTAPLDALYTRWNAAAAKRQTR